MTLHGVLNVLNTTYKMQNRNTMSQFYAQQNMQENMPLQTLKDNCLYPMVYQSKIEEKKIHEYLSIVRIGSHELLDNTKIYW